ncbi:hypothetical protein LCGC14_1608410 [marine sediment metagenome]|uniref:Uncharacterized protein n=1 Tax=marine sediment metagenome TaxID=412755 RepID=A0A0F9I9H2_9ZZZZ
MVSKERKKYVASGGRRARQRSYHRINGIFFILFGLAWTTTNLWFIAFPLWYLSYLEFKDVGKY